MDARQYLDRYLPVAADRETETEKKVQTQVIPEA